MARGAVHWVWNSSGDCAGYLIGDDFWTPEGRHAGRVHGIEIYDCHGVYRGEVMSENRLIFCLGKKNWYGARYTPLPSVKACLPRKGLSKLAPPRGYRDVSFGGVDFREDQLLLPEQLITWL